MASDSVPVDAPRCRKVGYIYSRSSTDADPSITWGNQVDWTANEAKPDPRKNRSLPMVERLFAREGIEFQLRRSRFAGDEWRLRIEVRDFAGERADIVFPKDSARKDTSHWAILRLGHG